MLALRYFPGSVLGHFLWIAETHAIFHASGNEQSDNDIHVYTVFPFYNTDGGIHRVDRVIAKLPYNKVLLTYKGNVLQWEPSGYHVISES